MEEGMGVLQWIAKTARVGLDLCSMPCIFVIAFFAMDPFNPTPT
jgi:hypothetical protein